MFRYHDRDHVTDRLARDMREHPSPARKLTRWAGRCLADVRHGVTAGLDWLTAR
ncbi:MAG: hypothetical protein ACRDQX_01125 [Pseudonocardiaceae bacterium]